MRKHTLATSVVALAVLAAALFTAPLFPSPELLTPAPLPRAEAIPVQQAQLNVTARKRHAWTIRVGLSQSTRTTVSVCIVKAGHTLRCVTKTRNGAAVTFRPTVRMSGRGYRVRMVVTTEGMSASRILPVKAGRPATATLSVFPGAPAGSRPAAPIVSNFASPRTGLLEAEVRLPGEVPTRGYQARYVGSSTVCNPEPPAFDVGVCYVTVPAPGRYRFQTRYRLAHGWSPWSQDSELLYVGDRCVGVRFVATPTELVLPWNQTAAVQMGYTTPSADGHPTLLDVPGQAGDYTSAIYYDHPPTDWYYSFETVVWPSADLTGPDAAVPNVIPIIATFRAMSSPEDIDTTLHLETVYTTVRYESGESGPACRVDAVSSVHLIRTSTSP